MLWCKFAGVTWMYGSDLGESLKILNVKRQQVRDIVSQHGGDNSGIMRGLALYLVLMHEN